MNKALAAAFFLTAGLTAVPPGSAARAAAASVTGDRLVVAVNNVPYTQRQVEMYVTVKESLRRTPDGSVRLINAQNWPEALAAFAEDTVILQEAQRLGSYSSADQAFDKYLAVVQGKAKAQPALAATLTRLGADDAALAHVLSAVLRVATFRRSKDRQESQSAQPLGPKGLGGTAVEKWLSELEERAIVRRFQGANDYVEIQPTAGAPGHGG